MPALMPFFRVLSWRRFPKRIIRELCSEFIAAWRLIAQGIGQSNISFILYCTTMSPSKVCLYRSGPRQQRTSNTQKIRAMMVAVLITMVAMVVVLISTPLLSTPCHFYNPCSNNNYNNFIKNLLYFRLCQQQPQQL